MARKLTNSILEKLIKEQISGLGDLSGKMTKAQQVNKEKERINSIYGAETKGIDDMERAIIQSVEDALTTIAAKGNLNRFKSQMESFLQKIIDDLGLGDEE